MLRMSDNPIIKNKVPVSIQSKVECMHGFLVYFLQYLYIPKSTFSLIGLINSNRMCFIYLRRCANIILFVATFRPGFTRNYKRPSRCSYKYCYFCNKTLHVCGNFEFTSYK